MARSPRLPMFEALARARPAPHIQDGLRGCPSRRDPFARAVIGEFSGYGTTVIVDGAAGHSSGTAATASASTTNTSSNAIAVFAWCEDDDGTNLSITGPTGYTALLSSGDTNTGLGAWHVFEELTSGGIQSPSLTMSGFNTHDE